MRHCLYKWISSLRMQPKVSGCCLPDEHVLGMDQESTSCSAALMAGTLLCAG